MELFIEMELFTFLKVTKLIVLMRKNRVLVGAKDEANYFDPKDGDNFFKIQRFPKE